jgi:hypothetical protein
MERRSFWRIVNFVMHRDLDSVAPDYSQYESGKIRLGYVPVCFNRRPRKLTINGDNVL